MYSRRRFIKNGFQNKELIEYKHGTQEDSADHIFMSADKKIRIVSIDPGSRNFSIRIEDRPRSLACSDISIDQIYSGLWDLGKTNTDRFMNLTEKLNTLRDHLETSDIIIVEEQLKFNSEIVRMAQHAVSWFYSFFWDKNPKPQIFEMPAKTKLRVLNTPTNLNKKAYKQWTVEWAKREFEMRGDEESLVSMLKEKKLDDISDTLAQIEAFCRYRGMVTSEQIYDEKSPTQ